MKEEEIHVESTGGRLAPARVKRVSWGAIFAGMFVTIIAQVMLTLLGTAIGAATVNPTEEQNPTQGLGIGSAIWLVVSALISVWCGAYVAGRLSGGPRRADGLIHGIVTWSVATCVMLFLLASTAGALIGGASSMLSSAMGKSQSGGGGGQGGGGSMGEQVKSMFPEAGALLPPTGGSSDGSQPPGQLTQLAQQDPKLGAALARMEKNGGASKDTSTRDQVVSMLTTQHGIDQQQATELVTQWDQQFQQAKGKVEQKARQTGEVAAKGISKGAFWSFAGLLLGLLAAAWGGWVGTASLAKYSNTAAIAT